ncbi:hypothetical protein LF63_0102620 [Oleiagrimonas soli]|nr:hypothetical protein LF63_0102620 [Oleiagrimonas soli]
MNAAAPVLRLDLPTSRSASGPVSHQVPRYIAGGRAFQQGLREAKRRAQRTYLPDDTVPGAPHFAMRDPRTEGVAGVMRLIQHHLIGVADPACVEAGTAVAMSKQQQAERHIDMDAVAKTIFEHHCVMQPHSWLAPDGPAVHLTARPPGHGMQ